MFQLGVTSEVHESPKITKRTRRSKKVELTDRDLEILRFVLEMKFSSAEQVFTKFFRKTRAKEDARSSAWAVKRLQQLDHAGFLKAMHSFSKRIRLFTVTYKGYYAVKQVYSGSFLVKPSGFFDQRTYLHDSSMIELRNLLEIDEHVVSWLSDRLLRSYPELTSGLTGNNVPDAIYTTPGLEKVALELEIAQKGKEKYREKIRRYLSILRSQETQRPFSKVRFICAKENVRKILENETRLYPEYFSVEPLINKQFEGNKNV